MKILKKTTNLLKREKQYLLVFSFRYFNCALSSPSYYKPYPKGLHIFTLNNNKSVVFLILFVQMARQTNCILSLFSLFLLSCNGSYPTLPVISQGYPVTLPLVSLNNSQNLQKLLDSYQAIRFAFLFFSFSLFPFLL